jgi:hypothetical protein
MGPSVMYDLGPTRTGFFDARPKRPRGHCGSLTRNNYATYQPLICENCTALEALNLFETVAGRKGGGVRRVGGNK